MTPTPVGMRCPECARERTKVKTIRSGSSTPSVTQTLIAINVIVFIAETATGAPLGGGGGGTIWNHGALFGPPSPATTSRCSRDRTRDARVLAAADLRLPA